MTISKEKIRDLFEKYILLIPVIFAIAVIPLIVRITYYDPYLSQYPWFADSTEVFDMFMYYKNQAMLLLDGVLVIAYVYLWLRKKLPMSLNFIPLLVYVILVALSASMSIAPAQTWYGFYGMMETAYALFGYCMICYYAFAVIQSEKQLKIVFGGFGIGFLILMLIGLSQYLGYDFYTTDIGQSLITPTEYADSIGNLNLSFGKGRVYGSLYNPNYVGVYCCILMPLLVVLAFSAKKKWQMGIYLLLIGLLMICLVGAGSKTAVIALVPCLVFIAIYYGKRHWKQMIPVYIVTFGVFAILNIPQGDASLVNATISYVTRDAIQFREYSLTDITLEDEAFYVTYNDEVLKVKYKKNAEGQLGIDVYDEAGNSLSTVLCEEEEESFYILNEEVYEGLKFVQGVNEHGNLGFYVTEDSSEFFIYYSENYQTYLYTNYWGRPVKLYSSESYDSPVLHMWGGFNGRGYIWSKSLPALRDTLIIGSGPDTFAFMFPQYDYVSLVQNGLRSQILTKPHSMYLQSGVQTGVLSVIAFLVFNIWYFIESLKLYHKCQLKTFTERCGAGIFIAVVGFLIAGLVHDSTIGTSIVYWTLLGIGMACNAILRKKEGQVEVFLSNQDTNESA